MLSDFKHFLLKTLHETILYYLHCFVDEGSFATLTASQHWNLNVCVFSSSQQGSIWTPQRKIGDISVSYNWDRDCVLLASTIEARVVLTFLLSTGQPST